MKVYGYARVSTDAQDLTIQKEKLRQFGCDLIRAENVSGKASAEERKELKLLLEFLREGDALVVTRVDRLARSMKHLQDIFLELNNKGVVLRAIEQPVDTSTASGKAFMDMLGVFAEFETNLRKERQAEGIAHAKAKGVYKGRKPTAREKAKDIIELTNKGLTRREVAERLNIGIASVYRVLHAEKASSDV